VANRQGWHGWDEYAPFYDWENAQTLGRRDVPFWRRVASSAGGAVLELGCGTGRVSHPLADAGVDLIGIDRSAPMLERARERIATARRSRRSRPQSGARPVGNLGIAPSRAIARESQAVPRSSTIPVRTPQFVRGDIRSLPFADRAFAMVLAPYGILQSLIRPRDLTATLASVARVIAPGGIFGVDLVPDVPKWREYRDRVQLRGKAGAVHLTLIESVAQDPRRQLTTFEQRYVERRGTETKEHRFELTFRTLSVPQMTRQLARAGFRVETVLGDYGGRPWDDRADVWIILARKG
jgi:ubiquinone/menaquinone biosynthesis C-methylase UbiE